MTSERKMAYYEANKDRLKAQMRAYSNANKARLKARKIILQAENKATGRFRCNMCDCNLTTNQNLNKHLITKRHKNTTRAKETNELPSKQ